MRPLNEIIVRMLSHREVGPRELSVEVARRLIVRFGRLYLSLELAKVARNPALFNAGHPLTVFSFLHTMIAGVAVTAVGAVLRDRGEPQVGNAIVIPDPIDVVNGAVWPFAMINSPSGVMRLQGFSAKKPPLSVALIVHVKGRLATVFSVPRLHNHVGSLAVGKPLNTPALPCKSARLRVVVNELANRVDEWGLISFHGATIPRCAAGARGYQ